MKLLFMYRDDSYLGRSLRKKKAYNSVFDNLRVLCSGKLFLFVHGDFFFLTHTFIVMLKDSVIKWVCCISHKIFILYYKINKIWLLQGAEEQPEEHNLTHMAQAVITMKAGIQEVDTQKEIDMIETKAEILPLTDVAIRKGKSVKTEIEREVRVPIDGSSEKLMENQFPRYLNSDLKIIILTSNNLEKESLFICLIFLVYLGFSNNSQGQRYGMCSSWFGNMGSEAFLGGVGCV